MMMIIIRARLANLGCRHPLQECEMNNNSHMKEATPNKRSSVTLRYIWRIACRAGD
jgi:hypothetical protein